MSAVQYCLLTSSMNWATLAPEHVPTCALLGFGEGGSEVTHVKSLCNQSPG